MLDLKEIDAAINNLEKRETSFASCAKLADLYAIRDHVTGQQRLREREYSEGADPVILTTGDSEFLRTVTGKSTAQVMRLMDELMDTLKIVNERVYESMLRKLQNIR